MAMTLNEYQEAAYATAVYPDSSSLTYPVLGLAAEAGEVAGKLAKFYRGDRAAVDKHALIDELGDCLWMIAAAAEDLGVSLHHVAKRNLEKLRDREARGVLKGDGDKR